MRRHVLAIAAIVQVLAACSQPHPAASDPYRRLPELDLRVLACSANPAHYVYVSREQLNQALARLSPNCRPETFDELEASFWRSLERSPLDWEREVLVVLQEWYGTSMVKAHLELAPGSVARRLDARIVWEVWPPPVTPDTTVRRFAIAVDRASFDSVEVRGREQQPLVLEFGSRKGTGWSGDVDVYGSLRAIFHEDQTQAMVQLDALLPDPQLYAVGALAGLSGEITIVGGRVLLSYPIDDRHARHELSTGADAGATLLIATRVEAWNSMVIRKPVAAEAIDTRLEQLIVAAGLDLDARIPILLEGEFEDLHWHVIDGRRLEGGGGSYERHKAASSNGRFDRVRGTLFGYYSSGDQGVFTHRSTRTHFHCLIDDPLLGGHVDRFGIAAGTVVKIPVPALGVR